MQPIKWAEILPIRTKRINQICLIDTIIHALEDHPEVSNAICSPYRGESFAASLQRLRASHLEISEDIERLHRPNAWDKFKVFHEIASMYPACYLRNLRRYVTGKGTYNFS